MITAYMCWNKNNNALNTRACRKIEWRHFDIVISPKVKSLNCLTVIEGVTHVVSRLKVLMKPH